MKNTGLNFFYLKFKEFIDKVKIILYNKDNKYILSLPSNIYKHTTGAGNAPWCVYKFLL